jgi:hypothetical protein
MTEVFINIVLVEGGPTYEVYMKMLQKITYL